MSTATVVHKLANIERLAGFAMVGSDDLVNAAIPLAADVPMQPRGAEARSMVVRSAPPMDKQASDKSLWAWGAGLLAGRAPA